YRNCYRAWGITVKAVVTAGGGIQNFQIVTSQGSRLEVQAPDVHPERVPLRVTEEALSAKARLVACGELQIPHSVRDDTPFEGSLVPIVHSVTNEGLRH